MGGFYLSMETQEMNLKKQIKLRFLKPTLEIGTWSCIMVAPAAVFLPDCPDAHHQS